MSSREAMQKLSLIPSSTLSIRIWIVPGPPAYAKWHMLIFERTTMADECSLLDIQAPNLYVVKFLEQVEA